MKCQYELSDHVVIVGSNERGEIIARSESIASEPQYCVFYANGQGVAVEQWWRESALIADK